MVFVQMVFSLYSVHMCLPVYFCTSFLAYIKISAFSAMKIFSNSRAAFVLVSTV